MNQATRDFIQNHLNDDVHSLALLADKYPDVDMRLAIRQIMGKQKVKDKIPTFFECENLLYPAKLSLEQASSEITAKYKSELCNGKILIDLTGGFGVDSYFFSFGFEKVIYVERQSELCEIAKHNFKALKKENIEVVNDFAESYLQKTEEVDWIYLDPSRRSDTGKKVVFLSDCEPNVTELVDKLLLKSNHVLIKLSPMIDIVSLTKDLRNISEIHIVAVENECKEVLAILNEKKIERIQIKTTHYPKNRDVERFDFFLDSENSALTNYTSQLKAYLYEPNSAIMKSGAFKTVSEKLHIEKLHTNSHLYSSNNYISDFPGRIFKIENVYDFSKKSLKKLHIEIEKANLTIRNFPMQIDRLRKKLKLAEGGENFIFATTLSNGEKVLINCRKA